MFVFNILKVLPFCLATANGNYETNVIDMDDILSENYMPGTLLVLENPSQGVTRFNGSTKNVQTMERTTDGSSRSALKTMSFHR